MFGTVLQRHLVENWGTQESVDDAAPEVAIAEAQPLGLSSFVADQSQLEEIEL